MSDNSSPRSPLRLALPFSPRSAARSSSSPSPPLLSALSPSLCALGRGSPLLAALSPPRSILPAAIVVAAPPPQPQQQPFSTTSSVNRFQLRKRGVLEFFRAMRGPTTVGPQAPVFGFEDSPASDGGRGAAGSETAAASPSTIFDGCKASDQSSAARADLVCQPSHQRPPSIVLQCFVLNKDLHMHCA